MTNCSLVFYQSKCRLKNRKHSGFSNKGNRMEGLDSSDVEGGGMPHRGATAEVVLLVLEL